MKVFLEAGTSADLVCSASLAGLLLGLPQQLLRIDGGCMRLLWCLLFLPLCWLCLLGIRVVSGHQPCVKQPRILSMQDFAVLISHSPHAFRSSAEVEAWLGACEGCGCSEYLFAIGGLLGQATNNAL